MARYAANSNGCPHDWVGAAIGHLMHVQCEACGINATIWKRNADAINTTAPDAKIVLNDARGDVLNALDAITDWSAVRRFLGPQSNAKE